MYVTSQGKGGVEQPREFLGGVEDAQAHAREVLGQRAANRLNEKVSGTETSPGDVLNSYGITKIILGGGAMLHDAPADLDFWPPGSVGTPDYDRLVPPVPPESDKSAINAGVANPHAKDLYCGSLKMQLCAAPRTSLEQLVSSFDFAHCQVGAVLTSDTVGGKWVPTEVHFTPAFVAAMLTQTTFYLPNHKWPLNSLARVAKVASKLHLTTGEAYDLARQVAKALGDDLKKTAHPDRIAPFLVDKVVDAMTNKSYRQK